MSDKTVQTGYKQRATHCSMLHNRLSNIFCHDPSISANNSDTCQSQRVNKIYLYAQQPIRFSQNHERWKIFMSCAALSFMVTIDKTTIVWVLVAADLIMTGCDALGACLSESVWQGCANMLQASGGTLLNVAQCFPTISVMSHDPPVPVIQHQA